MEALAVVPLLISIAILLVGLTVFGLGGLRILRDIMRQRE